MSGKCETCGLPVSPGICAPPPHVFHSQPGDCIAALTAQVATLEGELAAADEWILNHNPIIPRIDRACKECLSGGPIAIPGFQCVPHAAAARALVRRVRGGT